MRFSPMHGLVAAMTIALAGCGAKTPEEHLQLAQHALQANDLKTAEIEIKSVLQSAPDHAEARLLLAQTLQAQGRFEDSEKELRRALEKGASQEQVLPLLARILVKAGKYQEATEIQPLASGMGLQALADLLAEHANAYLALNKPTEAARAIAEGEEALVNTGQPGQYSNALQLAQARLALVNEKPTQAMGILDAALKHDAKFVEAMFLKARILAMEGKQAEALRVYEQIISTKPDEILAYLAIADAKLQSKDMDGAEKALQAAEKLNANMFLVKYTRAKLAFSKGDLKTANDALQQVLRVAPEHLPSIVLNAAVNFGLGNHEQSLNSAQKVLANIPGHAYGAWLVAANQLRMGNAQATLDTLAPLLKANPEDARLLALMGEAYLQVKQYDKAMTYLDRAAALQPKDPAIKRSQARGHLSLGRDEQAIQDLELAASLSDKASQIDMTMIVLQLNRRQFDKALGAIADLEKKVPNNPVTQHLRGGAYLGKGDLPAARKAFTQALAIQPGFYPAAANLARLDMADKKPDAARLRFEAVLKADEKNVRAMMAMAEIASAGNKVAEAVGWWEKAAKADSKAVAPRARLVRYYISQKMPDKALTVAREAVNANPGNTEAIGLLGFTQMASGDQPSALTTFKKLANKAPTSADAQYRLGAAQITAKQNNEGRAALEKALALDPGHVGALDGLMLLDMMEKNPDRALQRVRAFLAKNPKLPVGYAREGDILMGQGQYAEAAKAYERSLSLGITPKVFPKMLNTLVRSGNPKRADQKLTELRAQYPNEPSLQAFAAEYYMAQGRNNEALRLYEDLLRAQPNNPAILNNLAVLYQQRKDGRAQNMAEQALKLQPDNPGVMDTLGWILVDLNQAGKAVELLKKASAKAPKSATIRYHYAVALAKAGNKSDAKRELEDLFKSGGNFREAAEARKLLATL